MSRDAEFYIGYQARAQPGIALFVRLASAGCLALVALVGASLPLAHALRPPARFEYGSPVELTGTLRARPFPRLEVPRAGHATGTSSASSVTLVAPWKHGADLLAAHFDGQRVELRATLFYRDGVVLGEVEPGSIRTQAEPADAPASEQTLGPRTLRGEIVDSKCFFGVMNPGELKPHRACAARCISGGIPPVLCVRDGAGRASYFWLLSARGGPVNHAVLDFVAEPVEIAGELRQHGEQLWLLADPNTYRRLE